MKKGIQFLKFCIVGLSNTAISYFVYVILVKMGFYYLLASIMGYIISIINAFYWNNKHVFVNNSASLIQSFFKMALAYAFTGLVVSNLLLLLWVEYFNINDLLAPIINLFITTPLNFVINKIWAFRDSRK